MSVLSPVPVDVKLHVPVPPESVTVQDPLSPSLTDTSPVGVPAELVTVTVTV